MSHVMHAWQAYRATMQQIEERARSTPRLAGATGIYIADAVVCPRRASLRALRYPAAPPAPTTVLAQQAGIQGEEYILLLLAAQGWQLDRQVVVQMPWGNGRIDAVVYAPHPLLLEIKTSTLASLPYLPRPEHVDQLLLYQGFSPPPPAGVDRWDAELVYLLRSDTQPPQVHGIPVPWDPQRFEALCAQVQRVHEAVQRGTPVPLEACPGVSALRPPCQYSTTNRCPYWDQCWTPPETATNTITWIEV